MSILRGTSGTPIARIPSHPDRISPLIFTDRCGESSSWHWWSGFRAKSGSGPLAFFGEPQQPRYFSKLTVTHVTSLYLFKSPPLLPVSLWLLLHIFSYKSYVWVVLKNGVCKLRYNFVVVIYLLHNLAQKSREHLWGDAFSSIQSLQVLGAHCWRNL